MSAEISRTSKKQNMKEVQGYKLIRLKIKTKEFSHTVFAKENKTRANDPKKPNGKTLFLLNVPPYVTESNLKSALSKVGDVVSVTFFEKAGKEETAKAEIFDKFVTPKPVYSFKVAYVVFKSTKSLDEALKLKVIELLDEDGKSLIKSGVQKWVDEYIDGIQDEESLKKEVDEYMAVYDRNEQQIIQAEKSPQADDEGWITVTKRGRNAGFQQKESVINKLEGKVARSKKEKELKNFYTFQIRESKMQNIVSLRKKFEEDKKRIETLKQSRRFKPF